MALVITSSKDVHRAGSPNVGPHYINGESPVPHYSAAGQTGAVTWSDGGAGGTFNPAVGTETDYTPANKTRSIIITATDSGAGGVGTKALSVKATFPLEPNRGFDIDTDDDTKESFARDKSRTTRQDGPVLERRALELLGRLIATERAELRTFWLWHRKTIPFYFKDNATGELVANCTHDSGLKQQVSPDDPNACNMSVVVKGYL